ncbi:hypothetical protein CIRMBP1277_00696 [Enterococcus cecorum]|nr:hypothetical protein CIRMBP1277_00696 [Enterococcus cecorum]
MKNKYKVKGTTLHLTDLRATLHIEGDTSLITITFDKELLEKYAEDYIKANFEMSDDGWIRRLGDDKRD